MTISFDTQAATAAMECAGVKPPQARAIAAQLQAVSRIRSPITPTVLETALAAFKAELFGPVAESEHGLADHITQGESRNSCASGLQVETPMIWRIDHYPPGDVPSREYRVRALSLEAAKRELAAAIGVPEWTLR